jgi:hypothetical protein
MHLYIIDHNGKNWLFKLYTLDKKLCKVSHHKRKIEAIRQAQYLLLHLTPEHRDLMAGIQ